MRLLVPIGFAAALAACQSDGERREAYRAEKNRECIDSLKANPKSVALDAERFCGCVLDRQMAGRTAAELKTFQPTPQQTQEWGITCADASLRPVPLVDPAAPADPEPAKGGAEAAREAPAEGR